MDVVSVGGVGEKSADESKKVLMQSGSRLPETMHA
jgi:hypothetical protein